MKMKNNGIAYELRGDKYYPTLSLPAQNNYKIGKYGLLHLDYIKAHCKGRYTTILFSLLNQHSIDKLGKLWYNTI